MTRISLILLAAMTATGGLVSRGDASHAAELKVLTSVALTSVLDELAPAFEKAASNKLNIGYSLIADVRRRILDGETADVIILSRPVMDELQTRDKFAANSLVNVAGTPVSVAARNGAPKPDIHSVEAFKHTLLTDRLLIRTPRKAGQAVSISPASSIVSE